MPNDYLGLQSNGKKSHPHHRKKPKIDLWEITRCAQNLEIERPDNLHSFNPLISGFQQCTPWIDIVWWIVAPEKMHLAPDKQCKRAAWGLFTEPMEPDKCM
jgi:hypothetical protein